MGLCRALRTEIIAHWLWYSSTASKHTNTTNYVKADQFEIDPFGYVMSTIIGISCSEMKSSLQIFTNKANFTLPPRHISVRQNSLLSTKFTILKMMAKVIKSRSLKTKQFRQIRQLFFVLWNKLALIMTNTADRQTIQRRPHFLPRLIILSSYVTRS